MLYDIIHCIGWVKVECATSGVTAAPATAAAAAAVALTIQSQAGAMSGAAAVAAGASNTVPRHSA